MEKTKKCSDCRENKLIDEFPTRIDKRSGKTVHLCRCRPCKRKYESRLRSDGRYKKYAIAKKEARRERKRKAIAHKGGKCEICGGEFHEAAFDFHHKDPSEKDIDPGLMWQNADLEATLKRLNNCMLLCANCHRILHYEAGNLGEIKRRRSAANVHSSQRR